MRPEAKKEGGAVENPKMSKKVAGFFAKKGEKALASHEYREAAGKEEDTKAIAKKEERALKGAPADMKDYESKEHKAMGYKKGGKIKPSFGKKFGAKMKPPGPAKAPDAGMDMPAIGPMPPKDGASMLPAMPPTMKPPGMKKGGMCSGGSMKKYATGGPINGIPKPPRGEKYDSAANDWMGGEMETEAEKERKKAKPAAPKPKAYAKGGMVRADGAAMRGKTKCKIC